MPPLDDSVAYTDLRDSRRLRTESAERDEMIRELPWVQDGIAFSEQRAIEGLINIALLGGQYLFEVMEHPWVGEGKNKPAMETLGLLAGRFPSDFRGVPSSRPPRRPWAGDGWA